MGSEPVAGELFVEGRLTVAWLIAFCRPEAGAVRCEHLVADHEIALVVETELEFCIGNDDASGECIFCTFLI